MTGGDAKVDLLDGEVNILTEYFMKATSVFQICRNKQKPRIHIIEMACVAFCISLIKMCCLQP